MESEGGREREREREWDLPLVDKAIVCNSVKDKIIHFIIMLLCEEKKCIKSDILN